MAAAGQGAARHVGDLPALPLHGWLGVPVRLARSGISAGWPPRSAVPTGWIGRTWRRGPVAAAADAELAAALEEFFAAQLVGKVLGDLALPQSVLTAVSDDPLETWFEDHDLLAPMDHPEYGPYWQPVGKFSFDGRSAPPAATCSLGEHTAPVLRELGYDDAAIAELARERVIRLAD